MAACLPSIEDPVVDPLLDTLARTVSSARTLEELTRPLLEVLEAVTGLESTYLTRIDGDRGFQHIVFARNSGALQIPEGLSVSWGDTLCKRALEEGRMTTNDVDASWPDSDAARALGITTYVSAPVRTGSGGLFGTLCAASSSKAPLTPDGERLVAMFSRLIGQHIERELLLQELQAAHAAMEAAALVDPLTGLPNRRRLFEELERAVAAGRRNGEAIIVAFIDLDGFKAVNDRYGHIAGDRLLAAYGQRLSGVRRAEELIARYGGDEFVLVATHPREDAERAAACIADRLRNAAAAPFELGGITLSCSGASVGTVITREEDDDVDAILSLADARMYQAKHQGAARRSA